MSIFSNKEKEKSSVCITVEKDQLIEIERIQKKYKLSRSKTIRKILEDFFEREKSDN